MAKNRNNATATETATETNAAAPNAGTPNAAPAAAAASTTPDTSAATAARKAKAQERKAFFTNISAFLSTLQTSFKLPDDLATQAGTLKTQAESMATARTSVDEQLETVNNKIDEILNVGKTGGEMDMKALTALFVDRSKLEAKKAKKDAPPAAPAPADNNSNAAAQ